MQLQETRSGHGFFFWINLFSIPSLLSFFFPFSPFFLNISLPLSLYLMRSLSDFFPSSSFLFRFWIINCDWEGLRLWESLLRSSWIGKNTRERERKWKKECERKKMEERIRKKMKERMRRIGKMEWYVSMYQSWYWTVMVVVITRCEEKKEAR